MMRLFFGRKIYETLRQTSTCEVFLSGEKSPKMDMWFCFFFDFAKDGDVQQQNMAQHHQRVLWVKLDWGGIWTWLGSKPCLKMAMGNTHHVSMIFFHENSTCKLHSVLGSFPCHVWLLEDTWGYPFQSISTHIVWARLVEWLGFFACDETPWWIVAHPPSFVWNT